MNILEQAKLELERAIEKHKQSFPWLKENTIFAVLAGSHSYGTNRPDSDIDIRGICIPPKEYYFQFEKNFEQAENKDPDCVIFGIQKYFKLAVECNPSILEVMFSDPSTHIVKHPIVDKLIENRHLFLSKRVQYSFGGYATAQLKRMKLHYSWHHGGEILPPKRIDYGLPERTIIQQDQLEAAKVQIRKKMEEWDFDWSLLEPADRINIQDRIETMLAECQLTSEAKFVAAARSIGFNDNFIEYLQKENAYARRKQEYQNYVEWKTNRNPKRAELEKKFGYDTKFAVHLKRLLDCAEEILITGTLHTKRSNVEELKSIINGSWTYEQVIKFAEEKQQTLEKLGRECTIIPYTADRKKLNELCQEMIEEFLG